MKTNGTHNAIIALASAVREQANALILNLLAKRGVTDILPAHGAVLSVLFRESPQQMSALAKAIGRKKNTVTSLVGTLEERGYCRRTVDPRDARAQLVALTDRGEALRAVQAEVSGELLRRVWAGVSEQEKDTCVTVLQMVLQNLERDITEKKGEHHE
ncbi:MarR family transcriptional regulator [Desulfovibrio sp. OttesenSCG-928-O18]|nr:MarR family transcriptional regulator [Desulfovibrio sp. OttesenSCG-928-O18]